ncbi:MAG: hypothetical protein IJS60_08790 [Abditibacteriota bacterium]|nr:hypothetical protein [Abditibacteriota bacterium]
MGSGKNSKTFTNNSSEKIITYSELNDRFRDAYKDYPRHERVNAFWLGVAYYEISALDKIASDNNDKDLMKLTRRLWKQRDELVDLNDNHQLKTDVRVSNFWVKVSDLREGYTGVIYKTEDSPYNQFLREFLFSSERVEERDDTPR